MQSCVPLPSEELLPKLLREAANALQQQARAADAHGDRAWARALEAEMYGLWASAKAHQPCTRSRGVPVPKHWSQQVGALIVPEGRDAEDLWLCLDALDHLFHREIGASVVLRDMPRSTWDPDRQAALWIDDGRAVGVLFFVHDDLRYQRLSEWQELGPAAPVSGDDSETVRITGVWVARDYRGRGIAMELANAVADEFGMDLRYVLHTPPFTPAGEAFARAVSGRDILIKAPDRMRGNIITDDNMLFGPLGRVVD